MDDGGLVRIDRGRAGEKRQRRQRLEVRRVAIEIGVVGAGHVCSLTLAKSFKRANRLDEDK